MKKIHKRKLAVLIDYFLIGFILVACGLSHLPKWVWSFTFSIGGGIPVSLPSFGIFILLVPIAFKDFLFRNASLGKRIMGLCIVDDKGNVPTYQTMLKRGCVMPIWGYTTFMRSKFSDVDFEDWELKRLKTRVVDKKDFQKMNE